MKCPTCEAWTQVLETRKRGLHVTRRRYECANLHRFTTLESVINPTGPSSTPGGTAPSTLTESLVESETSTSMELLHGERA